MLLRSLESLQASYDYVVIGGGTAGLTLGQRLSEKTDVSVLVLEAGKAYERDPLISGAGQPGVQIGNPKYDWEFQTIPQEHAGNRQIPWTRGKLLGGTSAINFLAWTLPNAQDCDAWQNLGNVGWNWKEFYKYAHINTNVTQRATDKFEFPSYNGGDRELSFPKTLPPTELAYFETFLNAGVPAATGAFTGNNLGAYFHINTLDPKTNERVYSASVYFDRAAKRPNLDVLPEAYAIRIQSDLQDDEFCANAVMFTYGDSKDVQTIKANKEVILSAGALKSPHILELSGIGLQDVLSEIGIPLKVDLPVGENVQDHVYTAMSWQLKDESAETFELLAEPEKVAEHIEYQREGKGIFTFGIQHFIFLPLSTVSGPERAEQIWREGSASVTEKINAGKYKGGSEATLKELLNKPEGTPNVELSGFPGFFSAPNPPKKGKKHFSTCCILNHPFSRGSIHTVSSDPHVQPAFNPRYFEEDADLKSLVEVVKYARSLAKLSPLKDIIDDAAPEVNPGPHVQTDEELTEWVKSTVSSCWHTIGSTSMLPREKGGVVDNNFKVYGFKNLRVVDLGVIPLHVSAHTQSVAYAIGEYAAHIIKAELLSEE